MIDIGQNDLLQALYDSNLTYTTVVEKIPPMLLEIKKAIQVLVSLSQIFLDSFLLMLFLLIRPGCDVVV